MRTNINIESDRSGFTLIELVITIAIMAILFGIVTLNFQTFIKKNNIEKQTRELFTVLMEARNNSFMQKTEHGVIIKKNSYQLKSYTSDADTMGSILSSGSYTYPITNKGAALPVAGTEARFDASGFLIGTFGTTFNVDILDTGTSLNCLVIHAVRVNMGKWNATTSECEFK